MLDELKGRHQESRRDRWLMDAGQTDRRRDLELMRAMVKPGATTGADDAMAEGELAKRGAKSPFKATLRWTTAVSRVVCASVTMSSCTASPSRQAAGRRHCRTRFRIDLRRLRRRRGHHRSGRQREASRRRVDAHDQECLELASRRCRPGRQLGEIGAAVQSTPSRAAFTSSARSSVTESAGRCTRSRRSTTSASGDGDWK